MEAEPITAPDRPDQAVEIGDAIVATELRKIYEPTPASRVAVKYLQQAGRHPQGEIIAVDGVSLHVESHGSVGLVGESGSGKTTTARILVGLERPTSGSVLLFGHALPSHIRTADRRRLAKVVQMVFQDPYGSLDPTQSVRASILEILRLHTELNQTARVAKMRELLDAVGIATTRADALPRELSGGQRQRVAIARALASSPRILVLDEAVSALDVSIQAQILNLLNDLRESLHLTYLVISHDLAVIRYLVDEVAVMYNGRVVEYGPVEQVLKQPTHEYTLRLIKSVPRPGRRAGQGQSMAPDVT
jgi:peptide/nickel transport system ATP-binding protein